MAEALAMIANAQPFAPHRAHPVLDAEESLFETATEFCAALQIYAARAVQIKKFRAGRILSESGFPKERKSDSTC